MVPIAYWSPGQRVKARRWILEALDGVGVGDEHLWHESESGTVLHLRRRFLADELPMLDEAWLAVEPFDLGGGEDRIVPDWQ